VIHPLYGVGTVISVATLSDGEMLATVQFEMGALTVPARETFLTGEHR